MTTIDLESTVESGFVHDDFLQVQQALQSGGSDINTGDASCTNIDVPSDGKIYLKGAASDTYFMFNSSSQKLELWVNGLQMAEWG